MTQLVVEHEFTPYGGNRAAFASRAPEVLLSGPAGTGKSRALLERLHVMMLRYPHARGAIIRKTAASLPTSALKTWERFVIPESMAAGVMEYYGGSAREPAQYRYRNGASVTLGGMDKPTKIMSTEYDVFYVQEATELNITDWESLTTRLRNGIIPYQIMIADCNPDAPNHWLKQRADSGKLEMIESRHEDNPVLFDQSTAEITEKGREYLDRLDNLTGVRYMRLRKGLWVAAEGMIYGDEWDPAIHVIDPFPIPQEWTRYWAVDFGYIHPMVIQFWAEDPDGRLYMYREFYRTKRTVDQHAKDVLWKVKNGHGYWREPKPRAIICDHDAENREVFGREIGMSTVPAIKTVKPGIESVQRRLRKAGDGKARLFFFRNALAERDSELEEMHKPTCTVDEITGYVWASNQKEEPVKIEDDGMDAMRYMVAHIDLGSRPRVRFI